MFTSIAALALILELVTGYPDRVYRVIGHPVTWIGRLIAVLDRRLNREADGDARRRAAGIVALVGLLGVSAAVGTGIQWLAGSGWGVVVTALLAGTLIAQRSLASHVGAVATALETGGLEAGRQAVSRIVGRDPQSLDEAAVGRAAIESLAENFSDGITAPAFWIAVGGLPGGLCYKTVNTADSMIGHRTPRHQAFGWAAARLDDLVNLPASRLTGLLIVGAACLDREASASGAWRTMLRDARHHKSPNAGWPEAATAGALGLALAGPRSYGGVLVDDRFMGEGGRREVTAPDIRRALRLYWKADALLIALMAAIAGATLLAG